MTEELSEEQLLTPLSNLFNQKITKFPGALPVTLDPENVKSLRYGVVAALKADGERVFCFVSNNKLWLMRRNLQCKRFELSSTFKDFVFDAEFLPELHLLLLFDTLLYANEPAWRLEYRQRMELIGHFLTKVVPSEEQTNYKDTVITDPCPLPSNFNYSQGWKTKTNLQIQTKPIYNVCDSKNLWKARRKLRYECDGLIFTRLWCAYRPYCDDSLFALKWKPQITVDFRVFPNEIYDYSEEKEEKHVEYEFNEFCKQHPHHNVALYATQDSNEVRFASCFLQGNVFLLSSNQVCEFAWDESKSEWVWQKLRADKLTPNNTKTIYNCLRGIASQITLNQIVTTVTSNKRKRS